MENLKRRGRPTIDKEAQQVEIVKNNVYTRDFTNSDGTVDRWFYDFNKYPTVGLYKTELDIFNSEGIPTQNRDSVSKTKKTYLNPKNGKMVGYTRAKMLGLI
jgi:hypothetical protein